MESPVRYRDGFTGTAPVPDHDGVPLPFPGSVEWTFEIYIIILKEVKHMFVKEHTGKTVAIYCRVSTMEQAEEGYSIDEQEHLLMEFCEKCGYEIYQIYKDCGISGKDICHRPAMVSLLKAAEQKKFDMVLSWKINRISRSLKDAISIVETLEKNGISYRSYSEPFETDTPSGKMQFQMMALVGEFERNTLAQNVKMGMCAKARSGEWCGGTTPLGYDCCPIDNPGSKRKRSRLVINEKEAEIVREIYRLCSEGRGYKAIVNRLNQNGYRTKKGNQFAIAQVRDILLNPIYIGKVRYNLRRDWNEKRRKNPNPDPIVVDGVHEPIISKELWEKTRIILESRKGRPGRIYDGEYPLTGLLRCPQCGAGMVMSRTTNVMKDGSKKRIVYYTCGAWKNKGITACHSNAIRVEEANEAVFSKLEELMTDQEFLKEVVGATNRVSRQHQETALKQLKSIEEEVKQLEQRRSKIFEAYECSILTSDEFIERKKQINQELSRVQHKKKEAESMLQEDGEVTYEYVRSIMEHFHCLLDEDMDREQRKQLLHMLISKITMNEKREIDSIQIVLTDAMAQFFHSQNSGAPEKGVPFLPYKGLIPHEIRMNIAV